MGTRIVHDELRVDRSPSGLALRHLVTGDIGATDVYIGEQWLQPGEQVLLHTHPVEEVLIFTTGTGEAALEGQRLPVSGGVTIHIAAGEHHGFRNTGDSALRVFVIFPGNAFAQTDIVDDSSA